MSEGGISWLSYIFGAAGFAYGIWKDVCLRNVKKRGDAPFFIPQIILGKWSVWSSGSSKERGYTFSERRSLSEMENCGKILPLHYPNEMDAGVRVCNTGIRLRKFEILSGTVSITRYSRSEELYDLIYNYKTKERGQPVNFTIKFEAENGVVGKQVWQLEIGTTTVKRIKPK